MTFDMGWDFRGSSGYVTDPAYGVFAKAADSYPTTYTNGNGDSINAGWVSSPAASGDRDATHDPRIAGDAYQDNAPTGAREFKIDLSSGSAPGAATYTIDLAAGNTWASSHQCVVVKDNTSTVLDLSNGGAGYATASNHYIDATAADNTGSATWAGTPVADIVFATTTVIVEISHTSSSTGDWTALAHFRLTQQQAAAYTLALGTAMLTLTGQGVVPRAARRLEAEHASLAMTGQVAALRAARQVALAQAALTLTGQAATLEHGYTMPMAHAQLTVTGQTTTLRRTAQLLLDRGLLALHGQAVTLRHGGGPAGAYRQRRDTTQPFRRRWSA